MDYYVLSSHSTAQLIAENAIFLAFVVEVLVCETDMEPEARFLCA